MNKKFTFMVAALLAAGGFSANATLDASADETLKNRVVTLSDQTPEGRAYYVVVNKTTDYIVLNDGTGAEAVSEDATLSDKGQWKVVINSDKTISFVNAKTGKLMAFNSGDKTMATTDEEIKAGVSKFLITEGKLQAQGIAGAWCLGYDSEVKLVDNSGGSTAKAVELYEVFDTEVEATAFQAAEGTKFTLNFGDSEAEGDSTFVEVSAVTLNAAVTAFDIPEGTENGFMLMVSGEAVDGEIMTDEKFKAAKFVYLTKNRVENSLINDDITGYRYDVISGADLIKEDNEIDPDNAVFSAYTSLNQEGYIFKQNNVFIDDEVAESTPNEVWLNTINNIVASQKVDVHKSPVEITAGKGTRVDIKSIATENRVVNVLVKNAGGVFANALTVADGGTAATTVKKSVAMTNYPAGQWLISAVKDANEITLINLQNSSKTVANLKLYATDKAGEYKVDNSVFEVTEDLISSDGFAEDVTERVIKFQDVDSDIYNGYANFDDTELAGKTFKLKAVIEDAYLGEDVEVYMQAKGDNVAYVTDEADATSWLLTKSLDEENVVDTTNVESATAYNYYDAEGKLKEVKAEDKVVSKLFTYTFKAESGNAGETEHAAKVYLSTAFAMGDEDAASDVVIRQVALNKYQLYIGTADNSNLNSTSTGYAKIHDSEIKLESKGIGAAVKFELVTEEPAPSLAADSKHVTFSINGLNYVAMDANGNGVVANETSTLKAATIEDFTFWIDSVDAKAVTPSFFISKGGKMMVNGSYVAEAAETAYDNDEITRDEADEIIEASKYNGSDRLKFVAATRAEGDTLMINDNKVVSPAFKFNIVEGENGGYVLKNGLDYVGAINDQLVMTTKANAAVVEVATAQAPTSNEGVSATEVSVVANNGSIVVKNAAGKNVVVSTILGQVVANEVLTSDNATINVPAGIVVVAVEGESFKVNVK